MSTQKSVRVRCPHCNKGLSAPAVLRGKTVTCPNPACGKSVTLPPAVPAEFVAPVLQPVAAASRPARAQTETGPPVQLGRRRWLLVGSVAGGVFVLLLLCGVVVLSHLRNSSPDAAVNGSQAAQDPPGTPLANVELPAGPSGAPGYFELAQHLVDEHRTESKEPFVTSVEAGPGTNPLIVYQFVTSGIVSSARVVAMPPVIPIVQPDKLLPVVDRLANSQNPVVRLALDKFKEARERGDKVGKQIDAHVEGEKKRIAEITERARRGDFVETTPEVTEQVSIGNGLTERRVVRAATRTDRGPAMIEGAKEAARIAQECAPEDRKNWRHLFLEEARVEAWKAMAPRLAEAYPHHAAAAELVQTRITPFDPKTKRGPEFTAVNTGNQVLTNVTLIVQVYHFLTAPEETNYRVYFIPRWEVGRSIYLSLTLWRSNAERQGREESERTSRVGRPPDGLSDEERRRRRASKLRPDGAYPNPWLNDLGGVVKVVSAAWASEANQPEKITSFPTQAEAGALWEMKVAINSLTNKALRQGKGKFVLPAEALELQCARRVLTYAAPDSEPARQAQLLIANPEAYANQLKQEQLDQLAKQNEQFAKLTEPGARLAGVWKLSFGNDHWPNFPAGALANKDNHGKVALRINTRDLKAKTVTATLYDPEHPERQRDLKGVIYTGFDGRLTMHFPGSNEKYRNRPFPNPPREQWQMLTTPESLDMWADGDALTCGSRSGLWSYQVRLQPN